MSRLQYNIMVEFFKDEKFVWLVDDEGRQGEPTENLISACNKVYDEFGSDLDWEVSILALEKGNGAEELKGKIKELSVKHRKVVG
jgi:hypothetical protein